MKAIDDTPQVIKMSDTNDAKYPQMILTLCATCMKPVSCCKDSYACYLRYLREGDGDD